MALGAGGDRGRPLVWPPRLSLQSPSSSWVAAGAWAVGGQRTASNTQLLWGVKQSFGLLTPPPSLDGSAKHSSAAAASAAGQRRDPDWCFFRQRDAFFSSGPDSQRGPSQAGRKGYARSSVSQASSLAEPRGGPEPAGPVVEPRWPLFPFTLSWLLLGISVVLNLALSVYLGASS